MSLEEIRSERLKKLGLINGKGFNPYPAETGRTHSIAEVLKKFAYLAKSKKYLTLVGRVLAKREKRGPATCPKLWKGFFVRRCAAMVANGRPNGRTLGVRGPQGEEFGVDRRKREVLSPRRISRSVVPTLAAVV